MKKVLKYIFFVFIVFLCTGLSACSPKAEIELFRQEFGEIVQFFNIPMSETESEYVIPAVQSDRAAPLLERITHVELIPSPYNSKNSASSVSSLGSTEKLTAYGEIESEFDLNKFSYVYVSGFGSRMVEDVEEKLDSAGIAYTTVVKQNTAPTGEVFAIEYAGYSCAEGYYINPDIALVLYVSGEKPAETAKTGDNLVYITFDDGPTEKNTDKLLDILDMYGVKAAFFTMGSSIEKYPDSARAVVDRGHVLGCHSVTHDYKKIYASVSALEEEVAQWEEIAEKIGVTKEDIGQLTFRFPGGSVGNYFDSDEAEEMKQMLENRGYFVYDWNVVTNDSILYMAPDGVNSYDYIRETFIETFRQCLNENKSKIGAPIIILMHETVDETVNLLPWMLEYLINEGYVFGNLAEMGRSWTFTDR